MARVDSESAKLALMKLAEAFGVSEGAMAELQPLAEEARLYLKGGKAVYTLTKPVELLNGQKLTEIVLREPTAADYSVYARGMSVKVSGGVTEIDAVMMHNRVVQAVERLTTSSQGAADSPWQGVADRIPRREIRTIGEVCDALGFFE